MYWVALASLGVAALSLILVHIDHQRDRESAAERQRLGDAARARDWAVPTLVRARNLLNTWSPERTGDIVDFWADDGGELDKQMSFLEREWGAISDGLNTIGSGHPLKAVRDRAEEAHSALANYVLKIDQILQVAFITCDSADLAAKNDYPPQIRKAKTLSAKAVEQLDALTDRLHSDEADTATRPSRWRFWTQGP